MGFWEFINSIIDYYLKWIYGLRKRKGKEFNYYFNLEFEGEYLNGLINGKGKEYYDNKLIFEGEYLDGK